jgi:hypothetical protein
LTVSPDAATAGEIAKPVEMASADSAASADLIIVDFLPFGFSI